MLPLHHQCYDKSGTGHLHVVTMNQAISSFPGSRCSFWLIWDACREWTKHAFYRALLVRVTRCAATAESSDSVLAVGWKRNLDPVSLCGERGKKM